MKEMNLLTKWCQQTFAIQKSRRIMKNLIIFCKIPSVVVAARPFSVEGEGLDQNH